MRVETRSFWMGALALGVGGIFTAYGQLHTAPADSNGMTVTTSKLTPANNEFSLKLLRRLVHQDPSANVFISPFSVSNALCMTMNGAQGQTRTDMANALGLSNVPMADVNAENRTLLKSLASDDAKETVSIANAVWFDRRIQVLPLFEKVCTEDYNATATRLKFTNPSAAGTVNAWVDKSTRGRIKEIVAPSDLRDSAAVLTNAIYFKGVWSTAFKEAETKQAKFQSSPNHSKNVPMMHISSRLAYGETADFQSVELPYGNGDLSFTVVLPTNPKNLDSVLQKLQLSLGKHLLDSMNLIPDVEVFLPRFKAHYKELLNSALKAEGMASAFGNHADFKAMSPQAARLSKVIHIANLDVDERGTVAAAATAVTVRAMAMRRSPRPPIIVRVDHPFLMFIRDGRSGTILFEGVINDPQ